MKDTIDLLRKAAVQFRYYAQQHLAKTAAGNILSVSELQSARLKSAINLKLAEEIEVHLSKIEDWAMEPSERYMPKPVTELTS